MIISRNRYAANTAKKITKKNPGGIFVGTVVLNVSIRRYLSLAVFFVIAFSAASKAT